jgi:hypothetical protein
MKRSLNNTLPEQTVRLMDRVAGKGQRSSLIDHAVRRYIKDASRANLRKQLAKSYEANAEFDLELAREWFPLPDSSRRYPAAQPLVRVSARLCDTQSTFSSFGTPPVGAG